MTSGSQTGALSNAVPRRGFSREAIQALKEAHRFIYRDGLNRSQALDRVEHDVEQTPEVQRLVAFYRKSQRGVA